MVLWAHQCRQAENEPRSADGSLPRRLNHYAQGALVNPTPTGKLALKSGKVLSFDKTGRLTDGLVMDNTGFVLLCDPGPSPPCPKP